MERIPSDSLVNGIAIRKKTIKRQKRLLKKRKEKKTITKKKDHPRVRAADTVFLARILQRTFVVGLELLFLPHDVLRKGYGIMERGSFPPLYRKRMLDILSFSFFVLAVAFWWGRSGDQDSPLFWDGSLARDY